MCIRDRYSGLPFQTLRTFKMRGRQNTCKTCGEDRIITKESIEAGNINYELFCGKRNYDVCTSEERISVQEFDDLFSTSEDKRHVLLDVRPHHHYQISHLPNTYNITVKELRDMEGDMARLKDEIPEINEKSEVLVMCRYGNDSQLATRLLKDKFEIPNVKDIRGGLFKYIDDIDPSLPKY